MRNYDFLDGGRTRRVVPYGSYRRERPRIRERANTKIRIINAESFSLTLLAASWEIRNNNI